MGDELVVPGWVGAAVDRVRPGWLVVGRRVSGGVQAELTYPGGTLGRVFDAWTEDALWFAVQRWCRAVSA